MSLQMFPGSQPIPFVLPRQDVRRATLPPPSSTLGSKFPDVSQRGFYLAQKVPLKVFHELWYWFPWTLTCSPSYGVPIKQQFSSQLGNGHRVLLRTNFVHQFAQFSMKIDSLTRISPSGTSRLLLNDDNVDEKKILPPWDWRYAPIDTQDDFFHAFAAISKVFLLKASSRLILRSHWHFIRF